MCLAKLGKEKELQMILTKPNDDHLRMKKKHYTK